MDEIDIIGRLVGEPGYRTVYRSEEELKRDTMYTSFADAADTDVDNRSSRYIVTQEFLEPAVG